MIRYFQCWHAYIVFVVFLICMCPTFLFGSAGIYALGAVAAKYIGNKQEMDQYVMLLSKVIFHCCLFTYPEVLSFPGQNCRSDQRIFNREVSSGCVIIDSTWHLESKDYNMIC